MDLDRSAGCRTVVAAVMLLAASAAGPMRPQPVAARPAAESAAPGAAASPAALREIVDWLVAEVALPRAAADPRIALVSASSIATLRYGGLAPPGRREPSPHTTAPPRRSTSPKAGLAPPQRSARCSCTRWFITCRREPG
jgi:hypothetical protein